MVLGKYNVGNYTRVYYISHLLDGQNFWASDKQHLQVASNYFSQIDISELAPASYNKLSKSITYYEKLISTNEKKIENQKSDLAKKERTLNNYNSFEVDQYNLAINAYNQSLETQSSYIDIYNSKVNQLNEKQLVSRCITSVGGGINLRPSEFKSVVRNKQSAKIRKINEYKKMLGSKGSIPGMGSWVRNRPDENGEAQVNPILTEPWEFSKSVSGEIQYSYHSASGNHLISSSSITNMEWKQEMKLKDTQSSISYSQMQNLLTIRRHGFDIFARIPITNNRVDFFR